MKIIIRIKQRGNIQGLAKHMMHKFGGDPGFFTKCMSDEEMTSQYPDTEARSAVCARLHKEAVGKWPGEGMHGSKKS